MTDLKSNPYQDITLSQRMGHDLNIYHASMNYISSDLRVCLPCVVNSFDPITQTITAKPCITEKIIISDIETDIELPLLQDIPVCFPRAGNFVITMPVRKGDECLIIFSDICFDAWYQSGSTKGIYPDITITPQKQIDNRRHDLSDGFAIIGPWSQPNVIPDFSTESCQIRTIDGETVIEVSDEGINLTTTSTININSDDVNIGEGSAGVARIGDLVAWDEVLNSYKIISGSSKVKAG